MLCITYTEGKVCGGIFSASFLPKIQQTPSSIVINSIIASSNKTLGAFYIA